MEMPIFLWFEKNGFVLVVLLCLMY